MLDDKMATLIEKDAETIYNPSVAKDIGTLPIGIIICARIQIKAVHKAL